MRIIYLGTPEFAVPTLKEIIAAPGFEVVGLLCQPDRPKGRGNKLVMPPTKEVALSHGITVFQPEKLSKAPEVVESMRQLQPDVLVMVAFGQILKKVVLEMAPHGVINLHGSLLPAYRGAAPINWSIINGESETGATTMFSDEGVDTGPMLLRTKIPIHPDMDAEELAKTMAQSGAKLVIETLTRLKEGNLSPQKQDDSRVTYAPILTKELAEIDWKKPAWEIHNKVRGLVPWPGTKTGFRNANLKILKTKCQGPAPSREDARTPGTLISRSDGVFVTCGPTGADRIQLIEVQPESRSRQNAMAWANGAHLLPGESFSSSSLLNV